MLNLQLEDGEAHLLVAVDLVAEGDGYVAGEVVLEDGGGETEGGAVEGLRGAGSWS